MIFNFCLRRMFLPVAAIMLSIVISLPLAAQNRVVHGVVIDADNKPVAGSTIQIKGTNTMTTTDANGKFTLSVPNEKRVLVISFVGKQPQEVSVNNQANIVVTLKEAASQLADVVVVGYGRQRKATVVGAIAQTTGKELERTGGVTNLGMALTGNLPGLVTTSSSGQPGGEDPQIDNIIAATGRNILLRQKLKIILDFLI